MEKSQLKKGRIEIIGEDKLGVGLAMLSWGSGLQCCDISVTWAYGNILGVDSHLFGGCYLESTTHPTTGLSYISMCSFLPA